MEEKNTVCRICLIPIKNNNNKKVPEFSGKQIISQRKFLYIAGKVSFLAGKTKNFCGKVKIWREKVDKAKEIFGGKRQDMVP
jgi:hypothetical protein